MIVWIIAAVVLVIVEVLTQMLWALCLALGCLGALVAQACGLGMVGQFVTIAVVALVAFVALMPVMKRWHERQTQRRGSNCLTGMDALIGRCGNVTAEIRPGQPGRVHIDGDRWQAESAQPEVTIPRGSRAVVTAYNSNILTVTPAPVG